MPANVFPFQRRARAMLAGLAVALSATACAPNLMQVGISTQLDNYMDRISKNCGNMYINGFQVWVIAQGESADASYQEYFLDQASMLLYGTITPEQYIADMSGYFDDMSPRGMKAYQCIVAQLPTQAPQVPKIYREVMKAAPQVSGND
ncbi:MAG: hypothetical protein EoVTN8_376 [Fluviibacter phosphoraccumulans EoVTN8]